MYNFFFHFHYFSRLLNFLCLSQSLYLSLSHIFLSLYLPFFLSLSLSLSSLSLSLSFSRTSFFSFSFTHLSLLLSFSPFFLPFTTISFLKYLFSCRSLSTSSRSLGASSWSLSTSSRSRSCRSRSCGWKCGCRYHNRSKSINIFTMKSISCSMCPLTIKKMEP